MLCRHSPYAWSGAPALFAAWLVLGTPSCGGSQSGSSVDHGDGGAPEASLPLIDGSNQAPDVSDLACVRQVTDTWTPDWKPPRQRQPGACTDGQIAEEQVKCEPGLPTYDLAACSTFNTAPANANCLQCLFSTEADPYYGPILVRTDGRWSVNVGGCMALIDGDTSTASCGAKVSAGDSCLRADYDKCWQDAWTSVCETSAQATACAGAPRYALCHGYRNFEEAYRALGALFCSAGPDAGTTLCETSASMKPSSDDLDLIDGAGRDPQWWVVGYVDPRSNSKPVFVPAPSPPAPLPVTAEGRTFLRMSGTGLGTFDAGTLTFTPRPSIQGGEPSDLSSATGIVFEAEGSNLWVDVQTVDNRPAFCRCTQGDCYVGYRYQVPVTASWATYEVDWDQLELPAWIHRKPPLDTTNIVTISFGSFGGDFDVAVDNLRLAHRVPVEAGSDGETDAALDHD
jgi:hypothetical protein